MSQLNFEQALKEEVEWQPDLVPKQVIDLALAGENVEMESFAEYLEGLTNSGTMAPSADLITAIKWRNGRRPVHVMPIHERTFYRAVVNVLKEDLPPLDRSPEAYDSFELGPAEENSAKFVIKTDIASYFSSIDHDLMRDEILARTGRSEIALLLCDFWRAILNRRVGIPQMSEPSKILSELLVDNLHRSLIRNGLTVWRYADDFRIAARSRHESIAALDIIHEESRRMGLSLNDWKTHLLSIEKYKQFINEDKEKEAEARSSAQQSLMLWSPYEEYQRELEVDEVYVEAAESLLREWRDETPDAVIEHSGLLQRHKLIRTSLNVLETFEDSIGLPYLYDVLLREPQLTPAVFRYIRSLGVAAPDASVNTCVQILESGILNRWQQLWLAWALQSSELAANRAIAGSEQLRGFLRALLDDRSELVRGQACLSLAVNNSLDETDWSAIQRTCGSLASPYAAAALAGVQGIEENHRAKLAATSKLERLAAEWGVACIPSK
ncbi:reverse transcriptase domain-containing protein [Streptomyces pseudovenezuelae]|uniref:reverse transcriptase domain-containing protein n=1 Tax=Streptomyces pseudovenezuelae TaxID=67350 RepID=UPI00371973A6